MIIWQCLGGFARQKNEKKFFNDNISNWINTILSFFCFALCPGMDFWQSRRVRTECLFFVVIVDVRVSFGILFCQSDFLKCSIQTLHMHAIQRTFGTCVCVCMFIHTFKDDSLKSVRSYFVIYTIRFDSKITRWQI